MTKRPRYTFYDEPLALRSCRVRRRFADLQLAPPSEPAWVTYSIASVIYAGCIVVMFAFVFM